MFWNYLQELFDHWADEGEKNILKLMPQPLSVEGLSDK